MTLGLPTSVFLQIHVIISLIGIFTGLVVLWGLLTGRPLARWTMLFLATTVLTSVSGFPLPPFGMTPARIVGIISIVLLTFAVGALYVFHLAGAWRWIYIGSAIAALWLNVFVGITQSFQKLPFLNPLAPTQSEPAFVVAQLAVLALFIVCGALATLRYHPEARA